jgi:integrase
VPSRRNAAPAAGSCSCRRSRTGRGAQSRSTAAVPLRPLVRGKLPVAVVFTTPDGQLIRDHHFRPVAGRVQGGAAAGRAGARPAAHPCRDPALRRRGAGEGSRRLGHASTAVTDKIYGQLRPNADEDVMAAIAETVEAIGWAAVEAEVDAELADEFDEAA